MQWSERLVTHEHVMCEGLIGPRVMEGRGQVNITVQYHQEWTTETAQEEKNW